LTKGRCHRYTQSDMEIGQILDKARGYLSEDKLASVEGAYQSALKAHQGQLRESGEPYLQHPLETASILVDLKLDASSIAAALLHDVVEDCAVPLSQIEETFGPEISKLVDGVSKISHISWQRIEKPKKGDLQTESLRKMLVAMAEDMRVVFIKLADRLHNMRTLDALPPARQRAIARETLEVYAPLAHRLGITRVRAQLEDLAFYYLQPVKYRHIERLIAKRQADQETFINRAISVLESEFEKAGLKVKVRGRSKNLYAVYKKIERYTSQGKSFADIYDIIALRVLVDKVEDCYHALGIIHNLWHPLSSEFNDYIANPKESGYQSLHTTVMCFGITPLEIQIRTDQMHHTAEYGIAAHWRYKEGARQDAQFDRRMSVLRQLLEWHKEFSGTAEFLESVKTDIFQNQVFVYTPEGEIKDMPAGSRPVDFAYRIHTDLGHRCIGAKVNGRLVPLTYQLGNGDTVEIITAKGDKGPSRDWLNPNLGYVTTSHARGRIRQWFKKQARSDNIEKGKELLEKELRRLGINSANRDEVALFFKYETLDDFYAAIGYGEISTNQIAMKLAVREEQPKVTETASVTPVPPSVKVLGTGELLTHIASCCNPLPGDSIIGYITRSRGVTVHRIDCTNVTNEKEKERLISVEWGSGIQLYPVVIRIDAWDRVGILRDITTLIAEEKINIASVNLSDHEDHSASVFITLTTKSVAQLSRLMSKIEGIGGVINVARSTENIG
jgi:guanosine-3',5'-bis(diphosphate) 3'-pyrophosphohydrolase